MLRILFRDFSIIHAGLANHLLNNRLGRPQDTRQLTNLILLSDEVYVLAHVASRVHPLTSSPGCFYRLAFFIYRNRQMSLIHIGQMSKWRIDGVLYFGHALKKRGQVFTRVGRLVNLYYVLV